MFSTFPLRTLRFKSFSLLLIGGALLLSLSWTPNALARGSSTRRIRSMMKAQQQKTVSQLQNQLTGAEKALSEAEAALSTSAASLQSAKGQLESARQRVDEKKQQNHDAQKALKEYEDKLLASQGPDSAVGKAKAELEKMEFAQDEVMHRVLSLPPHARQPEPAEFAHELLSLKPEQKSRLHADEDYQAAAEKVRSATSVVNDAKHTLFESDAGWQSAHANVKSSHDDLKVLEKNAHAASAEVAGNTRQVKAAQAVAATAQQVIMNSQAQLMKLGVKPKAPATK